MRHVWTEEEKQFIRENYPMKISMPDLAKKFDTSVSAINRIVRKVGCDYVPVSLRNARSGEKRRKWTRETLIAKIHDLRQDGPINSDYVQKNYGGVLVAACNMFGSYSQFLEAAGIDYSEISLYANRTSWTRQMIINEIRRMVSDNESVEASRARDEAAAVFNAARREESLGTWEAAVEAAGFDYAAVRGAKYGAPTKGNDGHTYASRREAAVGDALLVAKQQTLIRKYKAQVRVAEGRGWTCDFVVTLPSGRDLWIEVDGMDGARREGGYSDGHEKITYYQNNNFEFAVVRTANEVRSVLKVASTGKKIKRLPHPQKRRLVELGSTRYTDAELKEYLRSACETLRRPPTHSEFNQMDGPSAQTVQLRIGWAKTLLELGYDVKPRRRR